MTDDRRGVFRLKQVNEVQLSGFWASAVYTSNFGYFGGGSPGPRSTIDRIDYSNDTATASPRGPLSLARLGLAATGNSSFGYFGAGTPPLRTTVDRINYTSDTSTSSTRGPLSIARNYLAATGNNSFGYFGGGGPGGVSLVDRIDYSNDTATASPRGPLNAAKYFLTATGNSSFGYFIGGQAPGGAYVTESGRIDYSNDTQTMSGKVYEIRVGQLAATGNSSYGWFGGGYFFPPSTTYSLVKRIDYASDTTSPAPRGPLSIARYALSATGNNSYGYFGGGSSSLVPTGYSTIDRIDYSNDTITTSSRGPLSEPKQLLSASSAGANALPVPSQVVVAGYTPNIPAQIPVSYGYFGGGSVTTIDRIDYSNDTATASARGPLSLLKNSLNATGNSSFGYFGGGYAPSLPIGSRYISTVDRIDYSNDTASALVRGPLSLSKGLSGSTGNSSFGYFGGGYVPSPSLILTMISRVDRIDYANDTATASVRGPLSLARNILAATGNSSYGWFGGGSSPPVTVSTVDRIDYSNDTATGSPRGPLSVTRYSLAATGNSSYGWFGGGSGFPAPLSSVDRIDYSNDTATASIRGLLDIRRSGSATGNSVRGYFGDGSNTSLGRISYANDTVTALTSGNLLSAKSTACSPKANGLPQ